MSDVDDLNVAIRIAVDLNEKFSAAMTKRCEDEDLTYTQTLLVPPVLIACFMLGFSSSTGYELETVVKSSRRFAEWIKLAAQRKPTERH